MRIVIDMQGAQGANARRGIGRYAMSFAKSFISVAHEHEVIILLNGMLPQSVEVIREEFNKFTKNIQMVVWESAQPISAIDAGNYWRRQAAEIVREACIANLKPDFLINTSLFEGWVDECATSVSLHHRLFKTATILYDLIPYINPIPYLENDLFAKWYHKKIDNLKRSDLLLAISDSSREEAVTYLQYPQSDVVNISTASDPQFTKKMYSIFEINEIKSKFRISNKFLMYTGGIDHRKNIERLIESFGKIPKSIRGGYQLVIVCSIEEFSREKLLYVAKSCGLSDEEILFTGYVSEENLIALYHACDLFIFPSFHEGFGLPVLEAMRCGARVIGSNRSSLPEVIGMDEALFDPFDIEDMAGKISRAITDPEFRIRLAANCSQAEKFSWQETARRALAALEASGKPLKPNHLNLVRRPKLAYFSPLPPSRTGIADYSSELLPELARFYDIDIVASHGAPVSCAALDASFQVKSVEWFNDNQNIYDRVLYHFGNSDFHEHMFDQIEKVPGVVVLHDFYLSSIQAHREVHLGIKSAWVNELYKAHGYNAFKERFTALDTAEVVYKYPCNYSVLTNSLGVIVHSDFSKDLSAQWYSHRLSEDWEVIPLLRIPAQEKDKNISKNHLGFRANDYLICSFGLLGKLKQNMELLDAFLASELFHDESVKLIFVGEANGEYGDLLQRKIYETGFKERIFITGWNDSQQFKEYLMACDCAVQLRTLTRGETSAAVLDCMNYGIPTIVNAHGSMKSLREDCVYKLDDEFLLEDLTRALEVLWANPDLREKLGSEARAQIQKIHSPRVCSESYFEAIETFYNYRISTTEGSVDLLSRLSGDVSSQAELLKISDALSAIEQDRYGQKTIFVDISELCQRDARSGIQRVTRSILLELLQSPPRGYRVEPVYAIAEESGYRYARNFTFKFLDLGAGDLKDDIIDFRRDDIFIGLDLQPHIVPIQEPFLTKMRLRGVKVYFVLYDMLPIQLPHCFHAGASEGHMNWLSSILNYDGIITISKSTADQLYNWIKIDNRTRPRPIQIGYFHLGADLASANPTVGGVSENLDTLKRLSAAKSFLMVGTIEPRKGHEDILAAFDILWNAQSDVCLVIVGKQGWMVESLVERLRSHPKLGSNLFWFEAASDELLNKIYEASSCLIAASYDEGFGLPLVEAALHRIPLFIRDTPVFREVAGDHAEYFSSGIDRDLAAQIMAWLERNALGLSVASGGMPVLSWREATAQLMNVAIHNNWYRAWAADNVQRYGVVGPNFGSIVGKREAQRIITTGQSGYLCFGPYIEKKVGRYRVSILGQLMADPAGAFVDIAYSKGDFIITKDDLKYNSFEDVIGELEFVLERDCEDLEIRVWVSDQTVLSVRAVEICQLN